MPNKLNAAEAVYGFCGWLTSRAKITVMSGHHDATEPVGLVKQFCEKNDLPDLREDWSDFLSYPEEEEVASEKKEGAALASIPDDDEALDYGGDV